MGGNVAGPSFTESNDDQGFGVSCVLKEKKSFAKWHNPLLSPECPGSHLVDNQGMESVTWTLKQSPGSLLSYGPQDKSQTVLPHTHFIGLHTRAGRRQPHPTAFISMSLDPQNPVSLSTLCISIRGPTQVLIGQNPSPHEALTSPVAG